MKPAWRVTGTYFESCNCDAICPCRRTDGAEGGRSTHSVCDFVLSWWIQDGRFGEQRLDDLAVVMVGYFEDADESPWHVALMVDEKAPPESQAALAEIFLGRAGGTPLANFTAAIGEVRSVRPAAIRLDHRRGGERIEVEAAVVVEAGDAASGNGQVSCSIPGHDRPGTEVHAKLLSVEEAGFQFRFSAVCGFTTTFDYRSDS